MRNTMITEDAKREMLEGGIPAKTVEVIESLVARCGVDLTDVEFLFDENMRVSGIRCDVFGQETTIFVS